VFLEKLAALKSFLSERNLHVGRVRSETCAVRDVQQNQMMLQESEAIKVSKVVSKERKVLTV